MPGGIVFDYKCDAGHKMSKVFPPRTEYDKHAQLICPECLKADKTNWSYLIFAYPEGMGKKNA